MIFFQESVFLTIIEVLLYEVAWIVDDVINDFTAFFYWNDVWVDETAIRVVWCEN